MYVHMYRMYSLTGSNPAEKEWNTQTLLHSLLLA